MYVGGELWDARPHKLRQRQHRQHRQQQQRKTTGGSITTCERDDGNKVSDCPHDIGQDR